MIICHGKKIKIVPDKMMIFEYVFYDSQIIRFIDNVTPFDGPNDLTILVTNLFQPKWVFCG